MAFAPNFLNIVSSIFGGQQNPNRMALISDVQLVADSVNAGTPYDIWGITTTVASDGSGKITPTYVLASASSSTTACRPGTCKCNNPPPGWCSSACCGGALVFTPTNGNTGIITGVLGSVPANGFVVKCFPKTAYVTVGINYVNATTFTITFYDNLNRAYIDGQMAGAYTEILFPNYVPVSA